ncbi:hypothetical protein BDZ89DRAFT_1064838 [Hymenopellis radicata]|nr:hypothetical protein BDZ89DRAFT_1064838 [Hymenopellis radicata]
MESESTPDGGVQSPVIERRVLCDRCSGIVTSEIQKCNDLQASVSAALWQAPYFPSQSDLHYIQTRLDELYSQREAYDNEIVRVRKMLDMLVANSQGVNRCIDIYQSLSAPIRRLPADVLIHIFREALCFDVGASHSFKDLFNDRTRTVTTPLRLAKVCHLWRGIIFQNPLLWTYQAYCLRDATNLVAPIYQKESFPHSLNILVYSSTVFADYDSNDDSNSHGYDWGSLIEMQLLMKKLDCARWRRLSWDREDFDDLSRHSQTLQCDWSALEVLEIHPCEIDLSEGSPFACAPRLRTLRLTGVALRYDANGFANFCPWEQIEDLWIVQQDISLVNLCSARSLRHLTLQGRYGCSVSDISPEILARLEEVRFMDGWVLIKFLREASVLGRMGCLTSLELSNSKYAFPVWTPAVATLVVPPCPSLRNLIIHDVLIHNDTLIPLIRALENLRS